MEKKPRVIFSEELRNIHVRMGHAARLLQIVSSTVSKANSEPSAREMLKPFKAHCITLGSKKLMECLRMSVGVCRSIVDANCM